MPKETHPAQIGAIIEKITRQPRATSLLAIYEKPRSFFGNAIPDRIEICFTSAPHLLPPEVNLGDILQLRIPQATGLAPVYQIVWPTDADRFEPSILHQNPDPNRLQRPHPFLTSVES